MSVTVDFGTRDARAARTEEDYCDKGGAEGLAARIRAFWAERGYTITTSLVECGFHPAIRHNRWVVQSTLKDGLPPNYKKTA